MGMDASARFGYGFKITNKKLIEKINEEELELDKDFDVMFHGDDEFEILFICIKKSTTLLCNWDDPKYFSSDKFIVQEGWNEKLQTWAKENKISKPKIGWWLCCSMG
jgi:hypothetical protein